MGTISRRDLLKGGVAGGLAIASGVLGGSSAAGADEMRARRAARWAAAVRKPGSLPFPKLPAGTDTMPKIEHILVLMMENHSYDNYFGMLGRGPGQKPRGDGLTIGSNGLPTNSNPNGTGGTELSYHLPTTSQAADHVTQDWVDSHTPFDNGKNDGFVTSASGPPSMGYWQQADLPFYYSLGSTFPICDRWFCSLLGPTFPNRRYLLGGTSLGLIEDSVPLSAVNPPNGTIFDLLDGHTITWRDYYSDLPSAALWMGPAAFLNSSVVSINQFFTDAAAGTLPSFALIEPNYQTNSEEEPQDIVIGEKFAASVIDAVFKSPNWKNTLLVWNYDEHGGYYDHVPPPVALAPDDVPPDAPSNEQYDGFHRYGFRVPAAVISPYSVPKKVTSKVHDHTSVLAMVERKWNLPALTYRDANAADLMDFIDLSHAAFAKPPTLLPPQ
jgi:phospholipase C